MPQEIFLRVVVDASIEISINITAYTSVIRLIPTPFRLNIAEWRNTFNMCSKRFCFDIAYVCVIIYGTTNITCLYNISIPKC